MMIFFDQKTLSILRYVQKCKNKGASWGQIKKKFGEDTANEYLLLSLSQELYTVTKGTDGEWLPIHSGWNGTLRDDFRSYCTPKGNELLEHRVFDFWKWIIPTLISVAALCISCIGLLK